MTDVTDSDYNMVEYGLILQYTMVRLGNRPYRGIRWWDKEIAPTVG